MLEKILPSEINDLQNIARETFMQTFAEFNTAEDMESYLSTNLSIESLSAEMEQEGSEFYVWKEEEQWMGYIKLNYTDSLEIERLYVLAEHQGKGLGKKMMQFAFNRASELNFNQVWLGVWEHNHKAIAFYESLGFQPFGEHDFYLGTDRQRDLLFRKLF
jgi:ribosomal protein S18 acetylase RimI-like enzyme